MTNRKIGESDLPRQTMDYLNNKYSPIMFYTALMYHETTAPAKTKYYVSIENFKKQIQLLNKLNINSVDLENKQFTNNNKYPSTLLTFDDGHKSNLQAARILHKHKLKGYFFCVKDFSLNNPEYLTEKDIYEIAEMGHTIGVHGKDHKWWTTKSNQQLVEELTETKEWIENITGKAVTTCAAPGGVLNKNIIDCILLSMPEYKFIRTVKVGINTPQDKLIKIIPMHTYTNNFMFEQSVKYNPYYYSYLKSIYYSKEILRPIWNKLK